MDVKYPCPECGAILTVPEEHLGKTGKCNKCGKRILLRDARIVCPACRKKILVLEQRAGLTAYCGKCAARITFVLGPVGLAPRTDEQVEKERAAAAAREGQARLKAHRSEEKQRRQRELDKQLAKQDKQLRADQQERLGDRRAGSLGESASPEMKEPVGPIPNQGASGRAYKVESGKRSNDRSFYLGLAGSAALLVGVFAPLVHAPVVGSVNYFNNGEGDGVLIAILAVVALVMTFSGQTRLLLIPALLSGLIIAYTFLKAQNALTDLHSQIGRELNDNPFSGIAEVFANNIQLDWGWGALALGVGLLVGSSVLGGRQQGIDTDK